MNYTIECFKFQISSRLFSKTYAYKQFISHSYCKYNKKKFISVRLQKVGDQYYKIEEKHEASQPIIL